MKTTLLKYKIGLLILFVFAIVLVGMVIVQASGTKQDTKTNTAAQDIADKLNNYVSDNNTVPATLADAGAKNVPSSISYTKLSDTSYKFCATYKGNSSGFDASGVATDLMTGSVDSTPNLPVDNTELIIDSTYHKGANCQTVQSTPIFTGDPCSSATNATWCADNSGSNTSSASSPSLCDFGMSNTSGCQTKCDATTKTTAERVIDGTVTEVSSAGTNAMVLSVKDTKNALHQVSVTSNTSYFDSSCTTLDASNFQTGDEVRVIDDSAVVYPGGFNDKVTATELDDLSY